MTRTALVSCDRQHQHGTCPARTTEALALAAGWHLSPHGDYCPIHNPTPARPPQPKPRTITHR